MVRWRHNVPALKWERLARRRGRTAAASPARLGLAQPGATLATALVGGIAAASDPGTVETSASRPDGATGRSREPPHPRWRPTRWLGLHAGVPNGPTRSAAARRPRGESSGSAKAPGPHQALRMKPSKRVLYFTSTTTDITLATFTTGITSGTFITNSQHPGLVSTVLFHGLPSMPRWCTSRLSGWPAAPE